MMATLICSFESSENISEIGKSPLVTTTYDAKGPNERDSGIFISVEGQAEIIDDEEEMKEDHHSLLDQWFPEGVDTEGAVMTKVHANHIRWWDGDESGELQVD